MSGDIPLSLNLNSKQCIHQLLASLSVTWSGQSIDGMKVASGSSDSATQTSLQKTPASSIQLPTIRASHTVSASDVTSRLRLVSHWPQDAPRNAASKLH